MSYEEKYCQWIDDEVLDGDSMYETECGQAQQFTVGDIEDNNYKFCPFCGKEIAEVETEKSAQTTAQGDGDGN